MHIPHGASQRRYCVQTQECGETFTTAVRSSSVLMYEVSLRNFYVQLLLLKPNPIDGSLYLFYARNICHLDSLLGPIKNIVNFILSEWTTHITIFSPLPYQRSKLSKLTLYLSIELQYVLRRIYRMN